MRTRQQLITEFEQIANTIELSKTIKIADKTKYLHNIKSILEAMHTVTHEYLTIAWTMDFERMINKLNKVTVLSTNKGV